MVLKFRLISNEQDDFIRDIEMLDDHTFFHFHEAIQYNLQFDSSQIASFFICNEKWEKEQEITLFELSEEEAANVLVMDHTGIGNHIKVVHDKMLYVFDVFNERLFFIELVEIFPPDPQKKYPRCSFEKGEAPQQIIIDPIFDDKSREESTPLAEFYLDDEYYDEDDLDEPGFDQPFFDDTIPDEE